MTLASIRDAVERLRPADPRPDVFGAGVHRFELNPPLAEADVAGFEADHGIRLPADYRQFLIEVGDGGAGPYYGLFRLGERMDMRSHVRWAENDGVVGVPSEPFPHTGPWNDLTGEPTDEDEADGEDYDRKVQEFYERYFDAKYVNGAIPICELGCALGHWLVVTGPEAGHVWCDFRSDYRGIMPFTVGGLERVTFLQWYRHWLDEALRKVRPGGEPA